MIRLTIDGRDIRVADGATLLDAAIAAGVHIPTLCHVSGVEASVSCMVCVVAVEGMNRLVPSCAFPAAEGMNVRTDTAEVQAARRESVELLLGDHAGDCEAPCEMVCPAEWRIPAFLRALRDGETSVAAALAYEALVLPGTLGHVCPAPCEKACRRGRHDEAVSIRTLHRSFAEDVPATGFPPPKSESWRIAVVGAGPCGIGAAAAIRARGHACTIFEKQPEAGGGLRTLLESSLPPAVLARDLALLQDGGIELRSSMAISDPEALSRITTAFDAVVLAVGGGGADGLGLGMDKTGVRVDPETGETTCPGIFAAGGCVKPIRSLAVRALAQGRAAALAALAHCGGGSASSTLRYRHRLGGLREGEMEVFLNEAAGDMTDATDSARAAGRCLHCDCRAADACRLREVAAGVGATGRADGAGVRPDVEQDRSHPEVVYESGKCVVCGVCVRLARAAGEVAPPAFAERGFQLRVSPAPDGSMAAALTKSAAACVAACPTGALAWKREEPGA